METLQRTANRGSVSTGYDIDNSLKIEADSAERIYRASGNIGTPTSTQIATISYWIKRTELQSSGNSIVFTGNAGAVHTLFGFNDDRLKHISDVSNAGNFTSNAVFRDTAAWYHVVWAFDTTQGTDTNRVKAYVNGVQITSWSTATYPNQNNVIGLYETNMGHYFGWSDAQSQSGYYAEAYLIDGQQLAPTEFGEFDSDTGIWIPKAYTGSFGNEGYYLDFEDSSNLGLDVSGNSNNFGALYNISAVDQATDTPTNNFAIGNILTSAGGFLVPTEGATKGVLSTSGPGNNTGGASLFSTIPVSNGKWYFEAQNTNSGDVYLYLGVGDVGGIENWGIDGKTLGSATGPSVGWRGGGAQDGKVYINNSATGSADTWETEVVGVALDLDNNKVYFHKSGTYINSGDPASGTDNGGQYDLPTAVDDQWCIGVSAYNLATWLLNFGGYTTMSISSAASDANGYGTFEYAPPSGYYAICTKNLAEYG